MNRLQTLQQLIQTTIEDTASVIAPIFLLYGELDDELYQSSAQTIYDHVNFTKKKIKNYSNIGHLMTLGGDQTQLFGDILEFLQQYHSISAKSPLFLLNLLTFKATRMRKFLLLKNHNFASKYYKHVSIINLTICFILVFLQPFILCSY